MTGRLTPEQDADIARRLGRFETPTAIGIFYGIHPATVLHAAKRHRDRKAQAA